MESQDFKTFQQTGLISPLSYAIDKNLLHKHTEFVIMYEEKHCIEMLSTKWYLYRPSGKGRGKRSRTLEPLEKYMYNHILKSQKIK